MRNLSGDRRMIRFITIALVVGTIVIMLASAVATVVSITNTSSRLAMQEMDVMAINTEENFNRYLGLYYAIVMDRNVQEFLLDMENPHLHIGNVSNILGNFFQIWDNINFISVIREDGISFTRGGGIPYQIPDFEEVFISDHVNHSLPTGNALVRAMVCNNYSFRGNYSLTLFFPLFDTVIVRDSIGLLVINVNDTILDQLITESPRERGMYLYTYFVHDSGQIIAGPGAVVNTELEQVGRLYDRQIVWTWGYLNIYRSLNRWDFFYVTRISWIELLRDSVWVVGILFILLSTMIIFIIRASKYFLRKVKEEQYQIDQIQMEVLQSQIQPHFLYNTLDCIHWQAIINGDQETSKMIKALASYYRISLSKGKDIINIKEELEHIKNYLYIQKMRYGDILDYEITADENCLSEAIPKLTIQPLVENAIYHGIKCKDGRVGNIKIIVSDEGNRISIKVRDDGVGMSAEEIEEINKKGLKADSEFGYGARNVHRRIQLYYGNEYGLHYSMNSDKGITVMTYLPKER